MARPPSLPSDSKHAGQIYAEAESNANELVQFALPRRYRICGRRPNIAEAESNASLLAITEAQQYK